MAAAAPFQVVWYINVPEIPAYREPLTPQQKAKKAFEKVGMTHPRMTTMHCRRPRGPGVLAGGQYDPLLLETLTPPTPTPAPRTHTRLGNDGRMSLSLTDVRCCFSTLLTPRPKTTTVQGR